MTVVPTSTTDKYTCLCFAEKKHLVPDQDGEDESEVDEDGDGDGLDAEVFGGALIELDLLVPGLVQGLRRRLQSSEVPTGTEDVVEQIVHGNHF